MCGAGEGCLALSLSAFVQTWSPHTHTAFPLAQEKDSGQYFSSLLSISSAAILSLPLCGMRNDQYYLGCAHKKEPSLTKYDIFGPSPWNKRFTEWQFRLSSCKEEIYTPFRMRSWLDCKETYNAISCGIIPLKSMDFNWNNFTQDFYAGCYLTVSNLQRGIHVAAFSAKKCSA